MEEKLYCYGCGQILQSEDETKAGYVPEKILEGKENIFRKFVLLFLYSNITSFSPSRA